MAYRAGEKLTNERDGITHDYTAKQGVEHAEIILPEGVAADWARDRSDLWNAAEFSEKRKDARVAREFEIALPHELSAEQRLEATREFAQDLANRYGGVVDFTIHAPHDASDVRNTHAHVMMTTRQVTENGLGDKTYLERENKWLLANNLATTDMQLGDIRQTWEHIANEHMARAGLDIRIDHRSHIERGLEIAPTEHMGVHATQMERRGLDVSRSRLDEDAARRNAELIREKPEQVLSLIANEKSVFDRRDVARTLHRYINDDIGEFQSAFAKVMASPALVELQAERADVVGDHATGEIELARYSTREMVEIESGMIESAQRMHEAHSHGVAHRHVKRAIATQDTAIQRSAGDATARLSDEQRRAIEYVTGRERIAAVVGYAGAGKSTMLAAAREAWEAEGYTVHGAALSGKAAEGLEESSGIQSRTLASWLRGWENDRGQLNRGDVFVIDEAGMVGSRQLARFVNEAETRGAKIVLVGDHEQLQAIGAGAPFRAITEEIGHAELSEIRRQRVDWQREASVNFATHRTAEGLAAYQNKGNISFTASQAEACDEIVHDYLADRDERPEGTRVAMAHRRADVRAINEGIRSALQERGELAQGNVTFQTNDGKREFAPGDRIVFLENNRDLGVKNGMLATVDHVEPGRIIATLDGRSGKSVSVPMGDYQAVDHGYATTIHKNQGTTVDRSYVLASSTMDRHLTYVAMTRHREGVQLYAAQDDFTNRMAGRLIEHGTAPYEHNPENRDSYYVTLENDKGEQRTIWGVDLERAMKKAAPEIGDRIGLQHTGSEPVRLPDGGEGTRHSWKVRDVDELVYDQLEKRLSRSGVKETTLDYTRDFAERRGIAEQIGVSSEIEKQPRDTMQRKELREDGQKIDQVRDGMNVGQVIEGMKRENAAALNHAAALFEGGVHIEPDGDVYMADTQSFDDLKGAFSEKAIRVETMIQSLAPERRASVERELSEIYADVAHMQPLGTRSGALNEAPSVDGVYSEMNIDREALSQLKDSDVRMRIETAVKGTGISADAVVSRIETGANSAALERLWLIDDLQKIAQSDGLDLNNRDDLEAAVDRLDAAHVRLGEALYEADVLRPSGISDDIAQGERHLAEQGDRAGVSTIIIENMRRDSAADPFASDTERAAYRAEIEDRLDNRQLEDLRKGDEKVLADIADDRLDRLCAVKAYLQSHEQTANTPVVHEVNTAIADEEVEAARIRHAVKDGEKGPTHG